MLVNAPIMNSELIYVSGKKPISFSTGGIIKLSFQKYFTSSSTELKLVVKSHKHHLRIEEMLFHSLRTYRNTVPAYPSIFFSLKFEGMIANFQKGQNKL